MKRRASLLAALVALVLVATPAAGAGAFGAVIGPAPLVVGVNDPEVFLINTGEVPITAVVTVEGEGYGPALTNVPALASGKVARIPLTVGPGTARVRAVVSAATASTATDTARLDLSLGVRHVEWWETIPWGLVALLLFLAASVVAYLVRRRRAVR